MPALVTGEHLNRYVAPELIRSIRNTEDNFTKYFGKVNKSAITADGVSVQKLINDINVNMNPSANGTLTPRKMNSEKGVIPWQHFTTECIYFDKEELRALMYDKKGETRKLMIDAINNAVLLATLHAIAPASNAANTPIVETTGDDDGTGRKKLQPVDVLSYLRKTDMENPVLVLSKNHLIDLQEDETTSKRFSEIVVNQRNMKPVPYAGVNMLANDIKVAYTAAGNKRAIGATPAGTDKYGSVFIDKSNTAFYLHNLMFHMTAMENDTRNEIPRTELRITGTFMGTQIEDKRKRGVIIDGRV